MRKLGTFTLAFGEATWLSRRARGLFRGIWCLTKLHGPSCPISGLAALILLLRFHGISANAEQIRHRYGEDFGVPEMLRCAKTFKLKARVARSDWKRLTNTPLPAVAVMSNGRYLFLGKASD